MQKIQQHFTINNTNNCLIITGNPAEGSSSQRSHGSQGSHRRTLMDHPVPNSMPSCWQFSFNLPRVVLRFSPQVRLPKCYTARILNYQVDKNLDGAEYVCDRTVQHSLPEEAVLILCPILSFIIHNNHKNPSNPNQATKKRKKMTVHILLYFSVLVVLFCHCLDI